VQANAAATTPRKRPATGLSRQLSSARPAAASSRAQPRGRPPATTTQPASSPYAGNLQLTDIKMSTADNFMGATVTYMEGKVTNAGDKTVTHATVEVTFKNSLDQVVQQERPPLMVRQERPGYSDAVDLAAAPLAPGQSRPFRLTFEHVSSDWNGQYPPVKVLTVETR